nr:hypothetical protein [Tanacetum cinerariifolium]
MPELTSHGGTMAASLRHQWRDTIYGGVISPRRSLSFCVLYYALGHILFDFQGAYGCILGSNKDYEMHNSLFRKARKIEKQMNAKLVWLQEKYNYHSQTHIGGSSSKTREICDVYLTEKELYQLHLDEEALRKTLEEEARDEKEREEKIRQKQADDEEFFIEIGMMRYDSEYESD